MTLIKFYSSGNISTPVFILFGSTKFSFGEKESKESGGFFRGITVFISECQRKGTKPNQESDIDIEWEGGGGEVV